MSREYLYRKEGPRRLVILDAETLEQVGVVEGPEGATLAELEMFMAHVKREIEGSNN